MLELVSIELENFRVFSNATFTPALKDEGLTAIVGDNGSGKSSIVAALLFCLYGITPEGVPVKGLRKYGTQEPMVVRVNLNYNNQKLTVERSVRGNPGKTVAKITLNGEEQTSVSSRTATNWFTTHTGLNAESFTSAFVVKQKELDSLVKARPAERRKIIERLAGVERMSKAILLAKEELRVKKIALDSLTPPDEQNLETLQAEMNELEQEHETLKTELVSFREQKKELETEKQRLTELFNVVTGLISDNKNLTHKVEMKEVQLSTLEDNVAHHENVIRKVQGGGQELLSVESLEMESENLSTEIYELEKFIRELEEKIAKVPTLERTVSNVDNVAKNALKELESAKEVFRAKKVELGKLPSENEIEKRIFQLSNEKDNLVQKITLTHNAIEVADETLTFFRKHAQGKSSLCPTCEHPIENTTTLEEKLAVTKSAHEAEHQKLLNTKADVQQKLDYQKEQLQLVRTLLSNLNRAQQNVDHAQKVYDEKVEACNNARQELAKAKNDAEGGEEKIVLSNKEVEKLSAQLKKCNEILAKIDNAHESQKQLEIIEEQKKGINKTISSLSKAISNNAEKISSLPSLTVLENNLNNTVNSAQTVHAKAVSIEHKIQLNRAELTSKEKLYEYTKKTMNQYQTLRKETENLTATTNSLSEFRKDRLARLSPELSDITSDLLLEMTQGKYPTVEFDEDFTPYITNDVGETQPVAALSGGEESLVALAMRIAIGEILAGGRNGNLLILDEVLTAQDRNRRAATLTAVRKLDRQSVVINHIEEAADIADKVVYVVSPETHDEGDGSLLK